MKELLVLIENELFVLLSFIFIVYIHEQSVGTLFCFSFLLCNILCFINK
jgi:hypothetical protein